MLPFSVRSSLKIMWLCAWSRILSCQRCVTYSLPSHSSILHVPWFPSIKTYPKSKTWNKHTFWVHQLSRELPSHQSSSKFVAITRQLGLGHRWLPLHLWTLRTERQHQQHCCCCWRYAGIHYGSNHVTWIDREHSHIVLKSMEVHGYLWASSIFPVFVAQNKTVFFGGRSQGPPHQPSHGPELLMPFIWWWPLLQEPTWCVTRQFKGCRELSNLYFFFVVVVVVVVAVAVAVVVVVVVSLFGVGGWATLAYFVDSGWLFCDFGATADVLRWCCTHSVGVHQDGSATVTRSCLMQGNSFSDGVQRLMWRWSK